MLSGANTLSHHDSTEQTGMNANGKSSLIGCFCGLEKSEFPALKLWWEIFSMQRVAKKNKQLGGGLSGCTLVKE